MIVRQALLGRFSTCPPLAVKSRKLFRILVELCLLFSIHPHIKDRNVAVRQLKLEPHSCPNGSQISSSSTRCRSILAPFPSLLGHVWLQARDLIEA